jgi:hypothetical protein
VPCCGEKCGGRTKTRCVRSSNVLRQLGLPSHMAAPRLAHAQPLLITKSFPLSQKRLPYKPDKRRSHPGWIAQCPLCTAFSYLSGDNGGAFWTLDGALGYPCLAGISFTSTNMIDPKPRSCKTGVPAFSFFCWSLLCYTASARAGNRSSLLSADRYSKSYVLALPYKSRRSEGDPQYSRAHARRINSSPELGLPLLHHGSIARLSSRHVS